MYEIKPLGNGLYDILENGKSIRQGGPGFDAAYASKFGSLPSLAASGAPQAPSAGNTPPPTAGGPMPSGTGKGLVNFAGAINEALSMASRHRANIATTMMQPSRGTVMASDFASILGNLQNAGDTYGKDLTKEALEIAKGDKQNLREVSGVGLVNVKPDGTYEVIVPQKHQAGDLAGGAPPTFTKDDKTAIEDAFRTGTVNGKMVGIPMTGGYASPVMYQQMFDYWVNKGGTKQSFMDMFPPKQWLDPKNTGDWLWEKLDIKNPFNDDGNLF